MQIINFTIHQFFLNTLNVQGMYTDHLTLLFLLFLHEIQMCEGDRMELWCGLKNETWTRFLCLQN